MMNISNEVVRRLRLERGWTQDHLATLAQTSVKTIQRVEKSGVCSIETRSALASVLEVDLQQLDGEKTIEQAKGNDPNEPLLYHRVSSGQEIVDVFVDSYWYRFAHEDPRSIDDVEFIAGVVQDIQDWSEIWNDIEFGSRVKATYELGELLKQMEKRGIVLFGLRTRTAFRFPNRDGEEEEIRGSVANFYVAYADSESIIMLNPKQ